MSAKHTKAKVSDFLSLEWHIDQESVSKATESGDFPIVMSSSLGKLSKADNKLIRSVVMKGRQREKRRANLARIGSWIEQLRHNKQAEEGFKAAHGQLSTYEVVAHDPECWFVGLAKPQMAGNGLNFFRFVVELKPRMQECVYNFLTVLEESMYPTGFCEVYNIRDILWLEYFAQDAAYLHTCLFGTLVYLEIRRGNTYTQNSVAELAHALRLLQKNISDPSTATLEYTICAVASLATTMAALGDLTAAKQHVHGMYRIISLSGGLNRLNVHLSIKCCRTDLAFALLNSSKPLFFSNNIQWESHFTSAGKNLPLQHHELFSILLASDFEPDARLLNIWSDAREICAIINAAFLIKRKIKPPVFQEMMLSLQYRTLYLSYAESTNKRLHEALRLALLAFSTTIFHHIAGVRIEFAQINHQLKQAILNLPTPLEIQGWSFRFWLLSISRFIILSSEGEDWLGTRLQVCLAELQINCWENAKKQLKKGLWIDKIHDEQGKAAHEENV